MSKFVSGTVRQGGLTHQRADFVHEEISYPMLGVVLDVFCSDDALNLAATARQDQRAPTCQARVLVLQDGTDSPMILPNVTIMPPSGSGHDDFSEETPQPTNATIDGSPLPTNLETVDPKKLNGDWCVVHFIGGSIHQPVMLNWFPHPSNRKDPLTRNAAIGNLPQRRRVAKRFQGLRWVITSKGSLHINTEESNHPLNTDRVTRTENADGGDFRVTVKRGREFEVNFNPFTYNETDGVPDEPDLLWPANRVQQQREFIKSIMLMDQDFIQALAGRVLEVSATENLYIGRSSSATENIVLGQELKTLLQNILTAIIAHNHPTAVGPSGVPINVADFQNSLNSVLAEDQLSDWVFTQKGPPAASDPDDSK